ncbi:MAG: glycosyltransferase family 4 protein [Candidatus Tectimicrobiota bacterium]
MLQTAPPLWSQPQMSTSCHICLVTETYPPEVNGVAMTLTHLVRGLRARGYTVSVVRPRQRAVDGLGPPDDPRETLVYSVPIPGYRGVHVGVPAPGVLQRCWTEQRPDVVYVATQGPLGWSAVRTARRLGIPVFSGFHTNFHTYARHYRLGWLQAWIFACLRRFHGRTRGTLVPNTALRAQLEALGVPNVRLMGRGVDSQLFTPQRRCAALRRTWGVAEHDLVVLSVGRVAAEKNLATVVAAYHAMQRLSPGLRCVVVGDGPLRRTLQNAHPEVHFSGVQTAEQLARHYASADIFLFPSETETFGNVTLEAMASGLAVVAYDYAAAQMHITPGASGLLVPYGNTQAFIEAAVSLVRAPQRLPRLRQQARVHATTQDWQHIVHGFATYLLGARHGTPVTADLALT